MTVKRHPVGPRVDLFWCGVAFAAGFVFAVLVGAAPGEQARGPRPDREVPVTMEGHP